MKCPNCGKEIFDGQFRCHHCYEIVAVAEAKSEEKKPKKEAKEK